MEPFWQHDAEIESFLKKPHLFPIIDANLNDEQRRVFVEITQSIVDQIRGSRDLLRIFITGNAGTGKSFLFKVLQNQANQCHANAVVKVCAPTGVAAGLIGGSTLHSALQLPVLKHCHLSPTIHIPSLDKNPLQLMRQQWRDIKFIFIDEVSMVPYELLSMIDWRLKEIKNCDEDFGGLNVLLFGDLLQLPPVSGHQIFEQPTNFKSAKHLWRLFRLFELRQNVRQKERNFVQLLNALRVGELTSEHFAELMRKVSTECVGEFSIEKAIRIFPTNRQVEAHNRTVVDFYRGRNTPIFKVHSHDQIIRSEDADRNKTGSLPKDLEIFVGAKVMLRQNIDVSRGLVNGAIGHITEIIWPGGDGGTQFNVSGIPTVRVDFGINGIHIIAPKRVEFNGKFRSEVVQKPLLPLVLSWAATIHKLQGSTVEHPVVYLGPKLFAEGQAYVALSRVTSLKGLQIEELDCTKLMGKKCCNIKAFNEIKRMREEIKKEHHWTQFFRDQQWQKIC